MVRDLVIIARKPKSAVRAKGTGHDLRDASMSRVALFITTRTKPGKRDVVRTLWERHVRDRASANSGHETYFLCLDNDQEDILRVFEVFANRAQLETTTRSRWFVDYMRAIEPFLADRPEVSITTPIWGKVTPFH
jgi:quinol monooxygenase YgiN